MHTDNDPNVPRMEGGQLSASDSPQQLEQGEIAVTLERFALGVLGTMALNFAISAGIISLAPVVIAYSLNLSEIPSVRAAMEKAHTTDANLHHTSVVISILLCTILATPMFVSWWGAKNIINARVRNMLVFAVPWVFFDYQFRLGNSLMTALNLPDITIPILMVVILAYRWQRVLSIRARRP